MGKVVGTEVENTMTMPALDTGQVKRCHGKEKCTHLTGMHRELGDTGTQSAAVVLIAYSVSMGTNDNSTVSTVSHVGWYYHC